jgi:beta-galactosidase/beta-glucuronidase
MQILLAVVVAVLLAGSFSLAAAGETLSPSQNRKELPLSDSWQFQPDAYLDGEALGFFRPDYNASRWRPVTVPCAVDGGREDMLPVEGTAWFRRPVQIPADWQGQHVVLRFEGVNYHARVWVNGQEVGTHEDGFLRFEVPVHGALRFGAENVVVVRVDNAARPGEAPGMQVGWRPYGGILREVCLIARHPVHVGQVRVAAAPEAGGGKLSLVATVENTGRQAARCRIEVEVRDSDRRSVGRFRSDERQVPAGAAEELRLEAVVPAALRWTPGRPALYTAAVALRADGQAADAAEERFGFRKIETRREALLLNGEPVYLAGFNRHEDSPRTNMCTDLQTARRDLEHMKAAGANWVRLCHYPHHPGELALCDELGLLVMAEIPLWQWPGLAEGEAACGRKLAAAKRQLEAMIRRDLNHPSIILWSVSNETHEKRPEVAAGNRQLIEMAKRLDPTRLATHVSSFWQSFGKGDFQADDVLCVNWYPSLEHLIAEDPWGSRGRSSARPQDFDYAFGREAWRKELAGLHGRCPGRPILVTEFGYPSLPGVYDSAVGEDVQAAVIASEFQAFQEPWICGATIWCYADHPWPHNSYMKHLSMSPFGVVTRDRKELEAFRTACKLFAARRGPKAPAGRE